MSTKRDRTHLKTYFETGDRPTEEEFAEFIDSGLNQKEDDIHGDGNKNIGIGTETPGAKLEVNGDVQVNDELTVDGNAQVKGDIFGKDHNGSALNIISSKQGATGGAYVHMHGSNQAVNPQGDPHGNQGGFTFVAAGNGKLNGFDFVHFNVDNHNGVTNDGNPDTWHRSMRINGHGNVGIGLGSNDANVKLQVNGNVRSNDHDIYLRGDTDTNHGIGYYGGGKGVFNNGNHGVDVDGPVVYGFGGGALGINQNGTQYVNLHWDHNRRVGIAGLGGMQHHPARFQVWGDGQNAPVQIETAHNDAIMFYDADGSNKSPFTLVDKNGDRGFRFYAQGQNWNTIAEFTQQGSRVRKGLEVHAVGDASKTGLKLPSGAGDEKILVSNSIGEASWQDKTVVTNGLWVDAGNSNIENGNNGNVGIGTSNPDEKLHVSGNVKIEGGVSGNDQWNKFNIQAGEHPNNPGAYISLRTTNYNDINKGGIVFGARRSGDRSNGFTFLQHNPGESSEWPRCFSIDGEKDSYFWNNKIYLRNEGDKNHGLAHFGDSNDNFGGVDVNGPVLFGYNGGALGSISYGHLNHSRVALRWLDNGNVGIGKSDPKYLLHLGGMYDDINHSYRYMSGAYSVVKDYNGGSQNVKISLYAENRILATEFNAFSDARIKNIEGVSSGEKDLETLCKVQVTDYCHKDVIAEGKGRFKKLIGQQLKEVFPQAVSYNQDVIPDIYQTASVVNGWIHLNTDLKKGQKVRLIWESDERLCEVIDVQENRFKVKDELEIDELFVYGREVDDFHIVDYDAVSMLNVSATQELAKRVESQQKEIEALKEQINQLLNKNINQ